ncbi:MAG TPA: hypothetical protein VFH27_11770 [Longimicrobiaceae bacterium]|nr:hypothetical protein [Longimicrobiaceae bacterium]
MNPTVVAAIAFAVLLVLDWRFRRTPLRIVVALLAVVVLLLAQPNYTSASRAAAVMPPAGRVSAIRGRTLPEYVSGVYTMEEAVAREAQAGAGAQRIALVVLLWLACTPGFPRRRARGPALTWGGAKGTSDTDTAS